MTEEEKQAQAAAQPENTAEQPQTPPAETQAGPSGGEAPAQDESTPKADAAKPADAADASGAAQAAEAAPKGDRDAAKKDGKDWFNKKAHELEALKGKLDEAEKKGAAAREQLLRTAAEYDNYRKRSAREADQKFSDGIGYAAAQILPILDTLDMAAKAPCADENYKKGVMMTLDKAAKALQTLNIREIEAEGKPFDPNLMNAVSQVPAPEGTASGSVVTVYQKGYCIGDKIIRHATVVVAE